MPDEANRKPKTIKIPGADHPITIERNAHRIVVVVAGYVVADTRAALILREAGYPPVQYIPLKDVDTALLQRTDHATYCPYKGDCAYYSIPVGGERSVNAVWTYEAPYDAVAAIKDHVAFYPDRVGAIEERPESYPPQQQQGR
jgi:uncharacterized protein (DUF427 family)